MIDKLVRWTILGTIAGVILAFNLYHADYKLLVAQVGMILLVALWLVKYTIRPGRIVPLKGILESVYLWMGIFLLVCVSSYMSSEYKAVSGTELYKVSCWIIFGMIIGSRLKAQGSRQILTKQIVNTWIFCAGVVSIYGVLQFLDIDFMKIELPFRRVSSTFGNPTIFAGFLAMTIPISISKALSLEPRAFSRIKAYSLIALLIIALILTRSRAGIVAGLIGVMLVYGFTKYTIRPGRIVSLIIGAGVLFGGLMFAPQIREVVLDNLLRKTARVYLWGDVLEMIKQNVWYGSGIGTFSIYFPDFANPAIFRIHPAEWEFVNRAHSEYLELLSEMGIIGLMSFLCIIGVTTNSFIKKLKSGETDILLKGLFVSFIVILTHNLISVDMRYTSTGLFFWMMVGVLGMSDKGYGIRSKLQETTKAKKSYLLSLISYPLIITLAAVALFFSIKPYIMVNRVEKQEFFVDADKKIEDVGNLENMTHEEIFNLGVRYAKKKELNKAKRLFIETLIKNPEHAGALNNLGNIAFLSGDAGRARALFHKALKFERDNVEYLVNFAYACFKLNFMREAMDALDKALEIEPDNKRALLLRRQMTQ